MKRHVIFFNPAGRAVVCLRSPFAADVLFIVPMGTKSKQSGRMNNTWLGVPSVTSLKGVSLKYPEVSAHIFQWEIKQMKFYYNISYLWCSVNRIDILMP